MCGVRLSTTQVRRRRHVEARRRDRRAAGSVVRGRRQRGGGSQAHGARYVRPVCFRRVFGVLEAMHSPSDDAGTDRCNLQRVAGAEYTPKIGVHATDFHHLLPEKACAADFSIDFSVMWPEAGYHGLGKTDCHGLGKQTAMG